MNSIGKTIAAAGQFSVRYGEGLLKGVSAERFARKPSPGGITIDCNHPAWVYGHLAGYTSRMCEVMGLALGPTVKPAGWDELFKNGSPCLDDPAGTIYPRMETITRHYLDGYSYLLSKLPEVGDDVFAKPNPSGGRMAEMLPTVGALVAFLMTGHPMSHLGQVSTWRRCVGLGSAM